MPDYSTRTDNKYRDIRVGFLKKDIEEAVSCLQAGGLILMQTDTLYGIIGDALQSCVVERIFQIKVRDKNSALPVICGSVRDVGKICLLNDLESRLAKNFWPGPLTLILNARPEMPTHFLADDGTVAVRIPANELCCEIARRTGRPLTATSANLSGQPPVSQVDGMNSELRNGVDLIFDSGPCKDVMPSTIARVTKQGIRIVRHGRILSTDLMDCATP